VDKDFRERMCLSHSENSSSHERHGIVLHQYWSLFVYISYPTIPSRSSIPAHIFVYPFAHALTSRSYSTLSYLRHFPVLRHNHNHMSLVFSFLLYMLFDEYGPQSIHSGEALNHPWSILTRFLCNSHWARSFSGLLAPTTQREPRPQFVVVFV
jgi:hypothetical protein